MFASKDTLLTRPSGYNIARSVRLRRSASAYFSRTPASASNRQTWTWSGWVKRGTLTNENLIFGSRPSAGTYTQFSFRNSASSAPFCLLVEDNVTGNMLVTTQVFRDPSAWYHIVVAMDTTQATSSNRAKLYVNGVQVTSFSTTSYPAQNANLQINNTAIHNLGRDNSDSASDFDGYMAEVNFVDGQQLTPSSFGETDSITGVWKPKAYSGTYGTNGFELNFSDNSNNTAATIGKDYSGNGNNWTPNNISVTAGSTYDSMTDVPTLTSATAANYAVLNPLLSINGAATTFSNGNLQIATASGSNSLGVSTIPTSSGKWYFEATQTASGDATFGIWQPFSSTTLFYSSPNNNYRWYGGNGNVYDGSGSVVQTYSSYTNGDVLGIALDLDNGKVYYSKNNVYQGSSNPVTGTNPVASGLTGTWLFGCNTGGTGATFNANFGQRPFSYTPPTGFVALNTYNLPASTITNGAAYMAATTYTGTGSARSVTGVGFQPDFVWIKERSSTSAHALFDVVRGVQKRLVSNGTDAEDTSAQLLTAFNSDGFSVGTDGAINENTQTYIGWQWKANGTGVTNTNGSITSTVSAGATQGFSVVTYTGTGANATVGHGLGVAPSMIIVKQRSTTTSWAVYHIGLTSAAYVINLNLTSGQAGPNSVFWNSTAPTSSVFSLGTGTDANASGATVVAYCFAAVAGYSAFGSFGGNGTTDNTFIYMGFKPRFVLIKRTDGASNWFLLDSSRSSYNVSNVLLRPNLSDAEVTATSMDFVSNGIKLRDAGFGSGETYIYAAFAENPFKNSLAR